MTLAQQTPAELETPRTPPPRNGRWSGYFHLLMARMKELQREPEVIFWVFVFPLLLALGLGIAFRDKPTDVTSVAIVAGPGAQNALAMNALAMIERSPQKSSIRAQVLDQSSALQGFHLG